MTVVRCSAALAAVACGVLLAWQTPSEVKAKYRVDVNMVVLDFTVTDRGGNYVKGLRPSAVRLFEDGVAQRIRSFSEAAGKGPGEPAAGNNVFILFDTSNSMYESFTHAQDAIASLIRSLPANDQVAVYGFSRNLTRCASLTGNRFDAIRGLRDLTAGDDTALYNALLLTLRDATPVPGRKLIVVFSNGPDTASVVSPDDVRRVAEDEGIPIYVVSTRGNVISDAAFGRITLLTGGKLFEAPRWESQARAFEAIREDLRNSYTLTYYPAPNENRGFRRIRIQLLDDDGNQYRVRVRPGYRPKSG
jgi:Ca-activated chloride channel homolog